MAQTTTTTTAPVVDAQFCAPHATAFTVAKAPGSWFRRDLAVTDAGGAAVMRVEFPLSLSFRRRVLLLDAASRRPVVTLRRVPSRIFSATERWEAFRGSSTSPADLLFATVEWPIRWPPSTRATVHVHLAAGGDLGEERNTDFVVTRRGNHTRDYAVCRGSAGGVVVASLSRTIGRFGRFAYAVSVNAGVDHAFILALTMILEESLED
uniref:Uncharacterized protein n=1 Tax=Avena sativa TaxID=4498 RepID=A0ACD5X5S0_AVESA